MKFLKTALSLILVLSMVMSMMSVSAYADADIDVGEPAYSETNPYVLNFSGHDIPGYKNFDQKRFYFSPYRSDIYVTEDSSISWWGWCTASVLNMINTSIIDETTEATEPYASIPVYCVDAATSGVQGYSYRRIGLEESEYFDTDVAGRIRAIISNAFPYQTDMSAIAADVNAWIAENELQEVYGEVKDLNYYEVITSAQAAIWTITNDGYLAEDAYAGFNGYDHGSGYTQSWYAENCIYDLENNGNYTSSSPTSHDNINSLAHYYAALAPVIVDPADVLVSDASIEESEVSYFQENDGTYTAVITAKVSAVVDDAEDSLKLTAVYNESASESVTVENGTNTYTLRVEGMAMPDAVVLNLDGVQLATDIFLFDPLTGRHGSQTMAGYDSSALPVHVEKSTERPSFILPETGGISVNGVKVWNDSNDKDQIRPESIEVELYADGVKVLTQTVTSGADGSWSFSFNRLPAVNDNQTAIVYTVKEVAVEGYTTVVTGDAAAGFVITNSHTPTSTPTKPDEPSVDYVTVSVSKVWVDDDADKRPEEITVQLLKDGKPYRREIVLNEANQWSYEWEYLIEGSEYTVEEVNVPEGYTSDVEQNGTSFVVTNTAEKEETIVPEEPTVTPEDPDVPQGNNEKEDPLYGLDEDGIPRDYLELGDPDVPKTSDNNYAVLWITLAVLSAAALLGIKLNEKKRCNN